MRGTNWARKKIPTLRAIAIDSRSEKIRLKTQIDWRNELRLRERDDRTAPSFGDGISRSGAILADDIRVRKEDDNTILLGMKQSHRQEKVQHTMTVSSIEIVE